MRLFFFSLMTAISSIAFAQDWDKVEIVAEQVSDNIYMLKGSGGNMGLFVGDEGTVLIDDQFAALSDKIKMTIGGLSKNSVGYLINTHWHGDHTGGNSNFADDGAVIIAHENVRKRLSTDQNRPFGRATPAAEESAWPQLTFNEKMNVYINGESVQLIHVHNAHTDGDSFVYFPKANVLHMGDCFFNERFPYVDRDMGGSPDGAISAVELALMIVDSETKIIPGHGSLGNKSDLLRYHEMFVLLRDRVKVAISNGIERADLDVDALTEGYESWGTGFISSEKMVKMLYDAYSE